jgi:acetyl esterase/lipase
MITSIPIDNDKKVQVIRDHIAKIMMKPTVKVVHFTFPSRDTKGKVDLAVFFPPTPPHHHEEEKKSSLYPIIIWYHGGGMCIGDHRDALVPERLAIKCNAVVVSVGYRLAPASKFPGPVEDAYDALLWVNENANKINGDPKNISVIGESAGGNLAANVSILARDLEGPSISRMVLVCPWLDGTMSNPSVNKHSLVIPPSLMLWFRNNYIRTPKDIMDPRFSVCFTPNLSYLPKTLTIATDLDPHPSEGQDQ